MSGRAFEQFRWCEDCDCFAVPTDAGECGDCGANLVWKEGRE